MLAARPADDLRTAERTDKINDTTLLHEPSTDAALGMFHFYQRSTGKNIDKFLLFIKRAADGRRVSGSKVHAGSVGTEMLVSVNRISGAAQSVSSGSGGALHLQLKSHCTSAASSAQADLINGRPSERDAPRVETNDFRRCVATACRIRRSSSALSIESRSLYSLILITLTECSAASAEPVLNLPNGASVPHTRARERT